MLNEALSIDDFWQLSRDGTRRELVRGSIAECGPTGGVHGIVVMNLGAALLGYVKPRDIGYITAETGYILSSNPATVRIPDIAFVAKPRMTPPITDGFIPFAPDLAVEVVAPADTAAEVHEKVLDYLTAGTHLVWVIYPASKTAQVYKGASNIRLVEPNGVLDANGALREFVVGLREVFLNL